MTKNLEILLDILDNLETATSRRASMRTITYVASPDLIPTAESVPELAGYNGTSHFAAVVRASRHALRRGIPVERFLSVEILRSDVDRVQDHFRCRRDAALVLVGEAARFGLDLDTTIKVMGSRPKKVYVIYPYALVGIDYNRILNLWDKRDNMRYSKAINRAYRALRKSEALQDSGLSKSEADRLAEFTEISNWHEEEARRIIAADPNAEPEFYDRIWAIKERKGRATTEAVIEAARLYREGVPFDWAVGVSAG